MIFGINLSKFEKLKETPDAKLTFIDKWQFGRTKVKKYKFNNILDLEFDKFVDCENFIESEQFKKFCTIFVKRKWWQTIYLHELETIVLEYARQKQLLIEENDFIFNPPDYSDPSKELPKGIGLELRKEFVERFGNWVNIADTVCKGFHVSPKEIENWKLQDVIFWANYLKGQRIVENVK
jgi:hypothetical protein